MKQYNIGDKVVLNISCKGEVLISELVEFEVCGKSYDPFAGGRQCFRYQLFSRGASIHRYDYQIDKDITKQALEGEAKNETKL